MKTAEESRRERQRYLRQRRKLWKQHLDYRDKVTTGEPITAEDRQGEQEYIENCYRDKLMQDVHRIEQDLFYLLGTIVEPSYRGYDLKKLAYYLSLEELQELKTKADKIYVYSNYLYQLIERAETEHINRTTRKE